MAGEKILIVEDEAIIAEDLALCLTELGYTVCGKIASGEEAIGMAAKCKPQLALLDIHLAGQLSGVDAGRTIRAQFDIPIVYLTAHSDDLTLAEALKSRPAGFLTKPFDVRQVYAAVEIALGGHLTHPGDEAALREFLIDRLNQRRVSALAREELLDKYKQALSNIAGAAQDLKSLHPNEVEAPLVDMILEQSRVVEGRE